MAEITKINIKGVDYDIGGAGGGVSVINKTLDEATYSITFTEEEIAQLKNDVGIVVNVEADGMVMPLSQVYTSVAGTEALDQAIVLCCYMLGSPLCYVFTATSEDGLTFELTDTESPFGGAVDTSTLATKTELENLETTVSGKQSKLTVTVNGDGTIDLTIPK